MTFPVGIDLGTTFSVVAHLNQHGEPISVANAEGDRKTPSVVLFEDEEAIVGSEAKKALKTDPDCVADCSKRHLGEGTFPKLINGQSYPPEVIEAFILNKLRIDTIEQVGEFEKVVITVPAFFDEIRRKATQDAGYMAGLEVLDIINEPTAAAIAFAQRHGILVGSIAERNLLVYDLGGGTFDVSIVRMSGAEFVTIATDGDRNLGGCDWDECLLNFVADRCIRVHGIDLREHPEILFGKLQLECESAKLTLSTRAKSSISCEFQGQSLKLDVSKEEFEGLTSELLDMTRFTTQNTLHAASLEWGDIDHVLVVGGSTRMPMVREMLQSMSGQKPDTSVAADEAVAHGAALHAGNLLATSRGQDPTFNIVNVNSHSLGVVGRHRQTGQHRNGVVIPRNTPLPATCHRTFPTYREGQRSVAIRVVEGESTIPDDCTDIGQLVVSELPHNLPAGTPVVVSFGYEPNGRLGVRVTVNGSYEHESQLVRQSGLGKEELDGWRLHISGKETTNYW
jgi:molecular chaperone DnaK